MQQYDGFLFKIDRKYLLMRWFSFFLLTLIFSYASAQEFGGDPSTVIWKQVNTDTIRVIFPQGLDSVAKRIATITSKEQQQYAGTLGNRLRKVSIVLHPQTIFSNAYVALGPWRSEFFLTPEQNAFELSSISWTDLLSVHEYRHAEQYSNFNVGGSHIMRLIFGDNGQALANAAAIPDWFFEGDAVYNETVLSEQGRGRLPLFLNGYKSLYLQNRHYSYMKLRNGSLKDYVPDHYPLGYMLVAYGREKYGDDFWKNVTQDAARFHSLFYPMQHAVERYAHISFDAFIKNAFQYYQQQWEHENISNLQFLDSAERDNAVSEKFPYATEDGSLVMVRSTYRDNPKFVVRHADGSTEKISARCISDDDYFSYNSNKIVYTSFKPDARWGNREYSEIRLVDIKTKEEKRVTAHTRYFSPDISHNGKLLVAVELGADGSSSLVFLNLDGNIIKTIVNNSGHVYSYPKFSPDDSFVYVCDRNENGRMSILRLDVANTHAQEIISRKNRILGFPVVQNDTLLFSCSDNGRDEIWAHINSENKTYRVASAATGLYQAVLYRDKLITSAFTADGYRLAAAVTRWEQADNGDTLKPLYVSRPFQKTPNSLLENLTVRNFAITKYPKAFHVFNFHSWNPYFSDPDYSFILYGQNVLNTVQSQLYYTYNRDEHFHRVGFTGIYGGWYLQPLIDINQTWNRSRVLNADTSLRWNETKMASGFQLPLNFTGGKLYRYLSLSATYHLVSVQWQGFAKQFFNNSNFSYLQVRAGYSQYIQQAVQHIYPRLGQSFSLQYRTGSTAHQLLLNSYFYLPGLHKTHNLVLNFAFQLRDTSGKYFFDNNFPFSRGYTVVDYPRLWKTSANYHFPLGYPDCGFANLVYFLRIRANVFYDYTQAKSLRTGRYFNFASTGAELFFDSKWWNQQFISVGLRYSRLLNDDIKGLAPNQWEIIVPVNL